MVSAVVHGAANLGRKENKHRPHLLAFALDNITGNGIEQGYRAFHRVAEMFLKLLDMRGYRCFYLVNSGHPGYEYGFKYSKVVFIGE